MNAGSSPDTGTEPIASFVIAIVEPPTVEIDTEATAAYVRLTGAPVVRTEPFANAQGLVMLDFDADGGVVGIEIVGQSEFSIRELLKFVPVTANDETLARTRYVAADLQAA